MVGLQKKQKRRGGNRGVGAFGVCATAQVYALTDTASLPGDIRERVPDETSTYYAVHLRARDFEFAGFWRAWCLYRKNSSHVRWHGLPFPGPVRELMGDAK